MMAERPDEREALVSGAAAGRGYLSGLPSISRLTNGAAMKGFVSISDQGVVSATSFFLNVYLARKLPVSDYGLFVVAYTVVYLAAALQDAVFGYPLLVIGSKEKGQPLRSYASSVFISQAALSIAVAGLIILGLFAAEAFGWVQQATALAFFAVFGLFYIGNQFLRRLLYLCGKEWMVLIVDVVLGATLFTTLFVYSRSSSPGLAASNAALAGSAALAFVTAVFFLRGVFTIKGLGLWRAVRENLKFGKWLVAQNICTWCTGQIYYLVSAAVLGMQAPAALKVCANLLAPLQVIFQGIDSVMTLAISRRLDSGRARPFIIKAGAALVGFSALYCVVLPLFSDEIIRLFYGPAYAGSGLIVWIFAVAFFFRSVAVVPNLVLISMRATRDTFFIHLTTFFIGLAAMYPLLRWGQVAGAAVGTVLLPYFFWAVFMLWRVSKVFPRYETLSGRGG